MPVGNIECPLCLKKVIAQRTDSEKGSLFLCLNCGGGWNEPARSRNLMTNGENGYKKPRRKNGK